MEQLLQKRRTYKRTSEKRQSQTWRVKEKRGLMQQKEGFQKTPLLTEAGRELTNHRPK